MSRSIWVINRVGWEYDDSSYYRSGDGSPYQAYTDPEIALSFMKILGAQEIRSLGNNFFDFVDANNVLYGYSDEDTKTKLNELGLNYSDSEITFSKNIKEYSDEELNSILEFLEISFYTLSAVDLVA